MMLFKIRIRRITSTQLRPIVSPMQKNELKYSSNNINMSNSRQEQDQLSSTSTAQLLLDIFNSPRRITQHFTQHIETCTFPKESMFIGNNNNNNNTVPNTTTTTTTPSNNLNNHFSMDCASEDVEVEDETTEDDDCQNSPSKRTKGEKSRHSRKHPSKTNQSKRGRKEITKEEIKKYFNVSQSKAAKLLGVSVSTLKRRFYSMNMGRWPYPENRYLARKRSISYICSPNNRPEKQLDPHTLHVLLRAFKSTNPDNVLLSSNGQQ